MPLLAGGLWRMVQRRRASSRGGAPAPPPRWCGSLQDLQTLLMGSVVLEGGDDAELIPPSTSDFPAVKCSAGGVLVRVARDCDGATARYTPLVTLISTSTHIWPAVLASRAGDGKFAASCRANGQEVAVRVAGRADGRLTLQVLERMHFGVVAESSNVQQLARSLESGPPVYPWDEFMLLGRRQTGAGGGGEWGVCGAALVDHAVEQLGSLSARRKQVRVELVLAIMAAAAGLPEPAKCAMELSWR